MRLRYRSQRLSDNSRRHESPMARVLDYKRICPKIAHTLVALIRKD